MIRKIKANPLYFLAVGLSLFFAGWWVLLQFTTDPESTPRVHFGDTYGLVALVGGFIGLLVSKKWGGRKSKLGRAVLFFALGLLAQAFGQGVYDYYYYAWHVNAPYPSLGDLGYFGSILLYVYALWLLAGIAGIKISLRSYKGKVLALLIPTVVLLVSYLSFLKDYRTDGAPALTVFLDFGYPLGQAFYLSLAILIFFLTRKVLGGLMRPIILLLLFSLAVQYAADYNFLYQDIRSSWLDGGYGDLIYLSAYFLMTLSILRLGGVYNQLSRQ